jgi:intracellular sulfur oxidation DsrE/DsrF family protein
MVKVENIPFCWVLSATCFLSLLKEKDMKKIFLSACCLLLTCVVFAQQKEHKIVFDFTKGDTASFSTMMRQINNITKASPNSNLEIVCYGPGLDLLTKERSTVQKQIEEFHGKYKVVFAACEASMQRRGIAKSELLPQVTTVPLASLEIAAKQQEGWSYLKAGY